MIVKGVLEVLVELTNAHKKADISPRLEQLKQKLADATPVLTGHARDSWEVEGNKIVNRADYIDDLNGGSSAQAPSHFIEKTLLSELDVEASGIIVSKRPSDI